MTFNPKFLATGIGSFPDLEAGKACDLILERLPEIPLWPQLSQADFHEHRRLVLRPASASKGQKL